MSLSAGRTPVFQVERGCDAARQGIGCGCTGQCHELIDVVKAEDYWRVVGERDEARRGVARSGAVAPGMRVTVEEIEAARTPAGGWTRAQLAKWGVPWPPPKGWKKRLTDC